MKTYPPFAPKSDLEWLSKETRRAASKRFHEMWGAILKRNGFMRTGSAWYRVHGGQILQGIDFDPNLRSKHIKDLKVRYMMRPMFAEFCGFPPGPFLNLQQELTDYRYPGYQPSYHHTQIETIDMDESGTLKTGPVLDIYPFDHCSFFFALREVDTALEAELELFSEQTLPLLNEISDPISYAKNNMEIRRRELPYEHCVGLSPAGVDILMANGDWWLAEKSLRICLRQEVRIGMTQTDRKWIYDWYCCALQHVLAHDEMWLYEHFRQNLTKNWEILRRWNTQLYKTQSL